MFEIEMSQSLKNLTERTGYPLVQENGQRRYGPPPDWEGAAPPKGCEVFIGKIPRDLFEDELVPVMEKAGKVYELRIMVDSAGTNRGYGFVQYCTKQDAQTALHSLNNYEIRPKRFLGVMRSVDNNRLFVGGIPKHKNSDEVLEEMKRITEGVVKVILYPCINDRTKNRGYAFVEYNSHKSAAMGRRKLFSGRILLWDTNEVKVDWAEPELDVEADVMSKVKVLYIRNLALCTTEDDIRNLCGNLTGLERVKKQKDYAFVHFTTREQAERVKEDLNGKMIHGCELEITWAKPVKNREEYQQRKALARSMISAAQNNKHQNHNYLSTITVTGEPVVITPQVRRAAGTQGMQHAQRQYPMQQRPRTTIETPLMGIPTQLFIPQDPQIKSPSEMIMPGYGTASTTSTIIHDKLNGSMDELRGITPDHTNIMQGILQNPASMTSTGRFMNTNALRGPPLAPQYFMAHPAFCMAQGTMPAQHLIPHPSCIYPTQPQPITGYETIHPYALQAAFYQQAILPTTTTTPIIERPRYTSTAE